jgi:3-oxocholest-4-en-26-oyl-CoA dehydrogenase alpha subunit
MEFSLSPECQALSQEVNEFLRREVTDDLRRGDRYFAADDPRYEERVRALTNEAAARGWLSLQDTAGSVAAGVFLELVGFEDAPIEFYVERDFERLLDLVGTPRQKELMSPLFSSGSFRGAIALTEPGCGSDLAALRTTARREGDEYVIKGQKAFSTGAHVASHAIAAVRTDPEKPGKAGISLMLIDLSVPGVTISRLPLLPGDLGSCEIFFEDARVPSAHLIGEEGRGLRYALMLLQAHRIRIRESGEQRRKLDELVNLLDEAAGRGIEVDDSILDEVAWRCIEVEVAALLQWRALWAEDAGEGAPWQASMANLYLRETSQRIVETANAIEGPFAPLTADSADALAHGRFEQLHRMAPMWTVAGGTSEIQRNLIAEGALGLPRGR